MEQLDTQTLRLLLAAAGGLIIAAVYVWGRYKAKMLDFIYQRGEYDELGFDQQKPKPPKKAEPAPEEASPLLFDGLEDNEYFSMAEAEAEATPVEPAPAAAPENHTAPLGAPFLVQISVVAPPGQYFDGIELRDALEDLRLIYGDMGIFHRYDRDYRVPLFSVASLMEPGTFPIKDMEDFECPGVVLFYQPPQVDDPIAVFDDLVTTCHELALRLNAIEWDEKRQPLTQEKIARMRSRLREAY